MFLKLLFGYRTLDELMYAQADCWSADEARACSGALPHAPLQHLAHKLNQETTYAVVSPNLIPKRQATELLKIEGCGRYPATGPSGMRR